MTNAEAQINIARRYGVTLQEWRGRLEDARSKVNPDRDPRFHRDLGIAIEGCDESLATLTQQEQTELTEVGA